MTKAEIAKYGSLYMPIVTLPLFFIGFFAMRSWEAFAIVWILIFIQVVCLIYYIRNG